MVPGTDPHEYFQPNFTYKIHHFKYKVHHFNSKIIILNTKFTRQRDELAHVPPPSEGKDAALLLVVDPEHVHRHRVQPAGYHLQQ